MEEARKREEEIAVANRLKEEKFAEEAKRREDELTKAAKLKEA